MAEVTYSVASPSQNSLRSCEGCWALLLSPACPGVLFSSGVLSNTLCQALWGGPRNTGLAGFSWGGSMALWRELKYLLNTCCVPGLVLALRDTALNKTAGGPCAWLASTLLTVRP